MARASFGFDSWGMRPASISKPEHALDGELRQKSLPFADKRAKGAAVL
jgi:hypothetical protein